METENKQVLRLDHLIGETNAIYHEMSLYLGLSDSISSILYTLYCEGGRVSVSDLCRQTGLSRQTVHSALSHLKEDGTIILESVDRKSKRACLTESGMAFASQTVARIFEAENHVFDGWPREDVARYLDLMKRFRDDLSVCAKEVLADSRTMPSVTAVSVSLRSLPSFFSMNSRLCSPPLRSRSWDCS